MATTALPQQRIVLPSRTRLFLNYLRRNKSLTINEYRQIEDEEPFSDDEFNEPGIPGDDAAPALETP